MDPLYKINVNCACCESAFTTSRVRPSFKRAIRSDSDFCPYYKTVNPDYYVVRVCPSCGYAFTENFSERLSDKQKKAFYDKIGSHWKIKDYGNERTEAEAMECYKLALLTAQTIEENFRVIAGLLHHIAWLYRYQGNREQENRFLSYALDAYIKVYETERDVSNARLMYLIGELNRRLGNLNEAVRWFSRVVNDKTIMDAGMIRSSREMWQLIRAELEGKDLALPEDVKDNTV